jgi:ElaB/YqjD/DUF883 family membrane-anchored ribosome-binding protein
MDHDTEVIRQQMEQTRASLADKLETLENQVVHTVQEATEAVHDTVTNIKEAANETVSQVKDTMHETMQNVREAFDIPLQVQRHPWAMMAASVGVGYLGGTLLAHAHGGDRQMRRLTQQHWTGTEADHGRSRMDAAELPATSRPMTMTEPLRSSGSWLDSLARSFAPELNKLKGLAVGAMVAVARDLVTPNLPPQLQPQVQQMFDDVNTRLGGQAIQGPILGKGTYESESGATAFAERRASSGLE